MKPTTRQSRFALKRPESRVAGSVLLCFTLAVGAMAQQTNTTATTSTSPASAADSSGSTGQAGLKAETSPDTMPKPQTVYSHGIQAILDLADADVSEKVLMTFVETSMDLRYPSGAELVALKEHGVPDDVVTALMKRSATRESEVVERHRQIAVPAIVRDLSTGGTLDPDSYDFWYYHYAYPRALAYSYRTLTPYAPVRTYNHHYSFDPAFSGGRSRLSLSWGRFGLVHPGFSEARHRNYSRSGVR